MEGMVASGGMDIQAEFMRMNVIRGNARSWAAGLQIPGMYPRPMDLPQHHCPQQGVQNRKIHVKGTDSPGHRDPIRARRHISPEDQYLLEIDMYDMSRGSGESQEEYWLLAVQAARRAKLLSKVQPEGILG